jgi:serine protease
VDSSAVRPASAGPQVVAGEIVVKFKSELSLQSLRTLGVGGRILNQVRPLALKGVHLYRAHSVSAKQTQQLARLLEARGDVEWAEPNTLQYPAAKPNDSFYKFQWHYPGMNLEAAWDISTGTPGMVVGVIDSGIIWDGDGDPKTHLDLVGQVLPGYDFVSDSASALDGDGRDDNPYEPLEAGRESGDHGSHVAGTIAARTNDSDGVAGVNWQAKIVPVRALGAAGGSLVDIVEGTLWAAGVSVAGVPDNPNPAKVLNLSIQGESPCSNLYQDAFAQVGAAGVIVVVAAGNSNFDVSRSQPGNCNNVITVGATDIAGVRAPYSNFGAGIDVMAPGGDTTQVFRVDGQGIQAGVLSSVRDGEGKFIAKPLQGTSMAAPHIAGLVSIMKGLKPSLTTAEALSILKSSARPLSDAQCGQPNGCGAGLVDAAKALAALQNTPTPPPAPPAPPQTTIAKRYALALFQVGAGFDLNKSKGLEINPSSNLTPYQITGLEAGSYTVVALTDLNNNGDFDNGEPAGAVANVPVQAGKDTSNVVIKLQNLQLQSQSWVRASPGREGLERIVNQVLHR